MRDTCERCEVIARHLEHPKGYYDADAMSDLFELALTLMGKAASVHELRPRAYGR